jgi:predicted nucleotidyltransferase
MVPLIVNNLDAIRLIAKAHHVKNLWVFGSAATGRGIDGNGFTLESDVDLLVEFTDIIYDFDNFDYIGNADGLLQSLESLLERKVDLVYVTSLRNRRFIQQVEQQKRVIYAA